MDLHLVWVKSRKYECNVEIRCDECSDWLVDCMAAYERPYSMHEGRLAAR